MEIRQYLEIGNQIGMLQCLLASFAETFVGPGFDKLT
jgi:hypothetical protein